MAAQGDHRDLPGREGRRALGRAADPEALSQAAQMLRDRTMSLEPAGGGSARWIAVPIMIATLLVAVGMVVFRGHVKSLLGLV